MKRTIYDCWNCRHHNSDNPYGIDYCEVHDTRCSFAHDDCDDFEPDTYTGGNECHPQPPRRLTLIGWYLLGVITALLLGCLLTGCTTTRYVPVTETHTEHHWHTDTVRQTDSIIDHQTTTIREVDSATMAQYGIQMSALQTAWLIQTERLQRELSRLRESKTDTVVICDSIPYPVEVVKEVERKPSRTERGLMIAGLLSLIAVIIFMASKLKRFLS